MGWVPILIKTHSYHIPLTAFHIFPYQGAHRGVWNLAPGASRVPAAVAQASVVEVDVYREAETTKDFLAQPVRNTIWAKSRKYKMGKNRKCMRRHMLKILASHIMCGGLRPPLCGDSSCGPLILSAFASACIFCFCHILYFLLLAHLLFSPVRLISFPVQQNNATNTKSQSIPLIMKKLSSLGMWILFPPTTICRGPPLAASHCSGIRKCGWKTNPHSQLR